MYSTTKNNRITRWFISIALLIIPFCLTYSVLLAAELKVDGPTTADAISNMDKIPAKLTASEEKEVTDMVLPVPPDWLGDLAGMQQRQMIRILVPYSRTFFYIDRGQQKGLEYEIGKALEKWLNTRLPMQGKHQSWQIVFIPVKRDELLPALLTGRGDIATGGLTVTPGRQQVVDFASPFAKNIRESLVTGPGSKKISRTEDLSGQEVMVRASSSYFEHLVKINADLKAKGLKPITIIPADEWLESEDLLEMVNAGLVKATVVDRYLAEMWQPLFTDLKIQDGLYIHEAGDMAWAIRKGSPLLKTELAAFVKQHKVGTTFGNIVKKRYVKNSERVKNATSESEMLKYNNLVKIFQEHGKKYDFDFLMLMAQGYQESKLNQKARSQRGAVGIMQLLPSTAADPSIGIKGIDKDARRNVEAGCKYMRLLADKYLNDEELTPLNRTLMSFAAYNAGPGNLRKFRSLAAKSGKDPNKWFQNVEYAAARIVGQETVTYVSNIYKYYVAYKLIAERNKAVEGGRP